MTAPYLRMRQVAAVLWSLTYVAARAALGVCVVVRRVWR